MTDTTATTTAFLDLWCAAEQAGDRRRLDDQLTDDFRGVGPVAPDHVGQVLERRGQRRPPAATHDPSEQSVRENRS